MKRTNYKKENQSSLGQKCKHLFFLIIIVAAFNPAKAIVANYTFSQSTGTYTPITGTTFVTGTWDDDTITVALPFTFLYNNIARTQISISTNGFVSMNALPDIYSVCGFQSSPVNTIAGYGTDLQSSTAASNVQYGTVGTAPNRQFVIQWTDCDHYTAGVHTNHWNFQIILNETSNTIQVIWGTSTFATTMLANNCTDAATESGDVGLLGNAFSDFNIRKITNGTDTWTTSVPGTVITDVCNLSPANFPAAGLTYTWTPAPLVAMTYTSSTTAFLNNAQSVGRNSTANQILQVQVVTSGSLSPFDVTGLTLSTAGCTDAGTDLASAKVYFTGSSGAFATTNQFGTTTANPNGTYIVNGTATLEEGTNYFWINYDITGAAVIGDTLSGCCTQITGTGTLGTQVPVIICPSGFQTVAEIGFWTPIAAASPFTSGGLMLLLTDGTVLCKTESGGGDGIGNVWKTLTPDIQGSYINGTWGSISAMSSTRLYFSTQILKDGRVYVAGGEYGTGGNLGETYDPLTNVWTSSPAPVGTVSDANSEILEDGRVLQAMVTGNLRGTRIYNPVTNTYVTGPNCIGIHNESAWVKLPDNSILFVDRLSTNSERYIPSLNQWVADGTVPVALYDPFGLETGGAVLLPDGRAFFIGSPGHTAYYTPSGNNNPGTWAAGPDIPGAQGAPDAAAAMMVNGKVLCAVSPVPTSADHFPSPTAFYEFNYLTNSFTHISAPFGGGPSENISCFITNMLDLPDGSVLYSEQGSPQYFVYTPGGQPLTAGKPTISGITQNGCNLFTITGTLFNGISQGATYGDDWQMSTNYPVIRLKSGSNVYYARTANWNSTGVQRGSAPDSAQFTLPASLPSGTYWLVVTANGIASDSVSFTTPVLASLSSTLTPPAICSNTAFTYIPTSDSAGATFTWTRAAVAGISNPAVTIPQTTNPNEILINTTLNPVNVIYEYTTILNGCGNTEQVTVTVNASIGITGPTSVCTGNSITLTGVGAAGYIWSTGETTAAITVSPVTATTYTVTATNVTGCADTISQMITVNQLPVVTFTGLPDSVCANSGSNILSGNPPGGVFTGSGITGNVFNPAAAALGNDTITYSYTDPSGCSNFENQIVNVDVCLGIAEAGHLSFNIAVNPNPAEGSADVSFSVKSGGNYKISLHDLPGRTVTEESGMAIPGINVHKMNLDRVAAGVYVIMLVKGNDTFKTMLVVE